MATAGMFDGVHLGHRHALEAFADEARRHALTPLVFTFSQHPLDIIAPSRAPLLLSTAAQRKALLESVLPGARVEILNPADGLLKLDSAAFLSHIADTYGARAFAMGFNNHIGSDRATASELGTAPIPVTALPPLPGMQINSSAIRREIAACRFAEAEQALGHTWQFCGNVVSGKQLGRTIGYPTANISAAEPRLLTPPPGVYAVDITLPDGSTHRAMANLGFRPTVDAQGAPMSFEVHILDFSGDLYGADVSVRFLGRLRSEMKFDSLDELRLQLNADAAAARNYNSRVLLNTIA